MVARDFGEIYNTGFNAQGFLASAAGEKRFIERLIEIATRVLCLGAALVRARAWEAARELLTDRARRGTTA